MTDFGTSPETQPRQSLLDFPQFANHALLSLVNQLECLEARVRQLESILLIQTDGSIRLNAPHGIALRSGDSQITLSKDTIQIDAIAIHLNAAEC